MQAFVVTSEKQLKKFDEVVTNVDETFEFPFILAQNKYNEFQALGIGAKESIEALGYNVPEIKDENILIFPMEIRRKVEIPPAIKRIRMWSLEVSNGPSEIKAKVGQREYNLAEVLELIKNNEHAMYKLHNELQRSENNIVDWEEILKEFIVEAKEKQWLK